eukprot:g2211.t1
MEAKGVKWKSTRDMFQCKRVWPLGSFIVKRDSYAEGDKSDHQVVNERYNQAVQFVMPLLARSDELFNMATGTMGGDVKKGALEKYNECGNRLWKRLVDSKAAEGDVLAWGVVDEATFFNNVPDGDDSAKPERSSCAQFAIPLKVVLPDKPLQDDRGNEIATGSHAYYSNPVIFKQIHVRLRPPKGDERGTRCRTGKSEPSVEYFFEKEWMGKALKKTGYIDKGARDCSK